MTLSHGEGKDINGKCPFISTKRTEDFWWMDVSILKNYEHKYKYGVPDQETSLEELKEKLESTHLKIRQRAYVVLLFWSGLRRREPLFLKKEDVFEKDGSLFLAITVKEDKPFSRLKRGQAGGPIELNLNLYGILLLKQVWEKTRKHKKLFPFSDKTGYRAVRKLWPKRTPHWLRHNRITKLRKKIDGEKVSLDDVKSFTGIKRDRTIQHYGMKTAAGIHRVAQLLE